VVNGRLSVSKAAQRYVCQGHCNSGALETSSLPLSVIIDQTQRRVLLTPNAVAMRLWKDKIKQHVGSGVMVWRSE
jgi:hypothetical protein